MNRAAVSVGKESWTEPPTISRPGPTRSSALRDTTSRYRPSRSSTTTASEIAPASARSTAPESWLDEGAVTYVWTARVDLAQPGAALDFGLDPTPSSPS